MTTYDERIHHAHTYENHIIQLLRDKGWTAAPFGQDLLHPTIRQQLHTHPTHIRWMPDIIAIKENQLIFLDAKDSHATDTGRHAAESNATHALQEWENHYGHPVYYVFPHHDWHSVVPISEWAQYKQPGPKPRNGSGTPYDLAQCRHICRHKL